LQARLKDQFGGLRIPQPAIEKMLERLRQRGFVRVVAGAYVRNGEKLGELTFEAERSGFIHMHDALVTALTTYANTKFRRGWSANEARCGTSGILERGRSFSCFWQATSELDTPVIQSADHGERFLVASFVQHLLTTDPATFGFLETVSWAVCLPKPYSSPTRIHECRSFRIPKSTSTLLPHVAMDCAGPARKDPCIELLEILHQTGAQLCCFRHTLGEIKGALENCASLLRDHRDLDAAGPAAETLRYFRSRDISYSDVLVKINHLQEELATLKITVVDTPDWTRADTSVGNRRGKAGSDLACQDSIFAPWVIGSRC